MKNVKKTVLNEEGGMTSGGVVSGGLGEGGFKAPLGTDMKSAIQKRLTDAVENGFKKTKLVEIEDDLSDEATIEDLEAPVEDLGLDDVGGEEDLEVADEAPVAELEAPEEDVEELDDIKKVDDSVVPKTGRNDTTTFDETILDLINSVQRKIKQTDDTEEKVLLRKLFHYVWSAKSEIDVDEVLAQVR